MTQEKIKVLIVDDSVVARDLLTFIIETDPRLQVIGYAVDGEKALQFIQHNKPDVVTMDVSMPNLDGFETTRRIMEINPIPVVIVSGLYSQHNVEASFRAMEAGALAILARPSGVNDPLYKEISRHLVETLKTVSDVKLISRRRSHSKEVNLSKIMSDEGSSSIEAIGIGASLGGPPALAQFLSDLPENFGVPIFIVQHIARGFGQGLVDWLQKYTSLNVHLARDNENILHGNVYVAPDNYHMEVRKGKIVLIDDQKSIIKPSVAHLFRSMAEIYGEHAIGIMLTGMGRDGAQEMLLMKREGAFTIAQDAETSIMFGMPKAAIELGAITCVLPLQQIASSVEKLVNRSRDFEYKQ